MIKLSDELLDYYGFIFLTRKFGELGWTFEQFIEWMETDNDAEDFSTGSRWFS